MWVSKNIIPPGIHKRAQDAQSTQSRLHWFSPTGNFLRPGAGQTTADCTAPSCTMKKGLSFYGWVTHCAHSAYREEGVSESRVINIMLRVADTDERKSYIFCRKIKMRDLWNPYWNWALVPFQTIPFLFWSMLEQMKYRGFSPYATFGN